MDEILPGIWRWTGKHSRSGVQGSSHWVPRAGAVIDPNLPERGLEAFGDEPPDRVLLSNRHHLRDGERFAEQFASTIHAPEPGLHEFEGGPEVRGFAFGEEVAPGIDALEVGAICPDEAALLIRDPGALLIADGIIHYEDRLHFVPDKLLGEDAREVKRGLREAYARLLDREFEHLLFAHGEPVIGEGKRALREFCA